MIEEQLTPVEAPAHLRELSPDVRVAVLLDAAGSLVAMSEDGLDYNDELAELVRDLMAEADAAVKFPVNQVEGQVDRGSVYVTRDSRYVLAAVTRRAALASLMFYDQRAVLGAVK